MTRRLRQLSRMLTIQRVLMKHGLDEIVFRTHLFRPLAWLGRLLSFGRRRAPLGVRLRKALEELGPIFVKFGQALSVRPDLLPPDVAVELTKLQDQVPPFAGEQAAAAIAAAFGRPVEQVFAAFERTPLAAASIAQVHAARLPDGRDVVVKILRPNVGALIQRDV
ncbi:MAG TPA: AarF/UbiB family protein, partial [Gammaproteobacteria bacterium]